MNKLNSLKDSSFEKNDNYKQKKKKFYVTIVVELLVMVLDVWVFVLQIMTIKYN